MRFAPSQHTTIGKGRFLHSGWLPIFTALLGLVLTALGNKSAHATDGNSAQDSCKGSARIITVGTSGGPEGNASRGQPATFFGFGQSGILIDAGEGTVNALAKSGITPSAITHVLITHLHFDHTAGLDGLISFRWLNGREGDSPLVIVGPKSTRRLVNGILRSLTEGEKLFAPMLPGRRTIAETVRVIELDKVRVDVYPLSSEVKLSAVRNSHFTNLERTAGGPASHSYSFRLDTACGAATFTGDSGPSNALAHLAAGSRVLVSEVIDAEEASRLTIEALGPDIDTAAMIQHMKMHHLSAQEVARTAISAGVPIVVLTHFVSADGETMKRQVGATYDGQVISATDGMAIDPW